MMKFRNLSAILITFISLSACTTTKTGPVAVEDRSHSASVEDITKPADGYQERGETQRPAVTRPSSPAIVTLLAEAQRAEDDGNHGMAAATLERAIRIDPKDAMVWNRLASLRLHQGNWQQALNMARKSNSLAAGNYALQLQNWQIILVVKRKVKDDRGVRDAQRMIERLQAEGAGVRS